MDKYFRLKNLATGDIYTLTQPSINIGRGPYNYLQVDSELASSQHAAIEIKEGRVTIEDLNSTNGTTINEMPVALATELMHGDVIGVGGNKFMLISPNKNDEATVFSLNMGGGTVLPDSKIAQLNAGALSSEESRIVTTKIVDHLVSQAKEGYTTETAILVTLEKATLGENFEFCVQEEGLNRWFIGRDDAFAATIEHPTISMNHATLSYADGVWTLKDNGSTNGTKVNGKRVVEAECRNGDLISLGKLNCIFGLTEASVETAD